MLRPGGTCTLVVQDSYYKDILLNLPELVLEMGLNLGWSIRHRVDFLAQRNLSITNPDARRYRVNFQATESVLVLEK